MLERRNDKSLIFEYVVSLKRRELDYEISKYLFNVDVHLKFYTEKNSQKFDYYQKRQFTGAYKQSYLHRQRKDNLVPIPKWSVDGRYSTILLTVLSQRVNIIPAGDLFMISSTNYSVTTTLVTGIAQLALLEYYYKEDFLPNQL